MDQPVLQVQVSLHGSTELRRCAWVHVPMFATAPLLIRCRGRRTAAACPPNKNESKKVSFKV